MNEKPLEFWRARASVSEALDVFSSSYMQEVWAKALERRASDPQGAVTSARTLLESICKFILDSANRPFREGLPLPKLYAETAKVLEMAPNQELAPIFNSIFTACTEVIEGIGHLRNGLSDSHGRGPFGTTPDWRHSELAVNLSGAMATYLAAVWKGRQPTVSDVVHVHLAKRELHPTAKGALERMARDLEDEVATKLTGNRLAIYFEETAATFKLQPGSVKRTFGLLRAALEGTSAQAFAEAAKILQQKKLLLGGKQAPRLGRVQHEDFDAVIDYLGNEGKHVKETTHKGTNEGMVDIAEFAIWSGRRPNDILKLQWTDVDFQNHTCKLPGQREPFPVLERAWEIIEKRRSNLSQLSGRIFPYEKGAITFRHRLAMRALVGAGRIKKAVTFHDYRYEAVARLLEKQYASHVVAQATGQASERILKIAGEVHGMVPANSN